MQMHRKYRNMTADEIILQLEKEYKDNADALETIERAKKDIEYIKSQEDYKGQTPEQYASMLADELSMWN